jgi:hypothetical protein
MSITSGHTEQYSLKGPNIADASRYSVVVKLQK